ncbi:YgiT-type zinc finger protein [Spirosoma sp.]|uniref:YgiT-type zinc finger protein n=1 Tax=Spirosoma sp. TaxID=1899569 RepID=UPI0026278A17|nr:YgiT-type zinc finger protein [Spirosoma sp.]MCX6217471.1 YgiT-type zinc finger protein [Spirosoma sp.]
MPDVGGYKEPGHTTFSTNLGDGLVVVRHVLALICDQCGETTKQPSNWKASHERYVRKNIN